MLSSFCDRESGALQLANSELGVSDPYKHREVTKFSQRERIDDSASLLSSVDCVIIILVIFSRKKEKIILARIL